MWSITRRFDDLVREGILEVGDGYRAKNDELGGTGPIFLRSAYLQDTGFILNQPERFIDSNVDKFRPKVSREGDVVVTTKGNSTGRVGRIREPQVGGVYSPHLSYWRSKSPEHVDQMFLYYWSLSSEFRGQLAGMAHGTDMAPYLSLRDQLRLQISLPAPHLQQAIGQLLGALDDKIELNWRMNETLEAMARAIFKDWFVDFGPTRAKQEAGSARGTTRTAETRGRAPYLAPEIWSLFPDRLDDEDKPEGWEWRQLVELCTELRRGISPKYTEEGGVRVLNQKCIRNRTVDIGPSRRHNTTVRSVDGRELLPGDVVVNSTGVGTLGRTAQIWTLTEPTTIDSHVTLVRPNPALISRHYFGLGLTGREAEIEALGEGSTGQTELARTRLGSLPVLIPAAPVQDAFENVAAPLVQRMTANTEESQTLAALRDLLLPKLMSGEIRVKDAEKAVGEAA